MNKFFKTPVAWRKRVTTAMQDQVHAEAQAKFHSKALSKVRAALGSECVFISHISQGKNLDFLAILNRDNKKSRVVITTGVTKASDFKAEHYKNLKEALDGFGRS